MYGSPTPPLPKDLNLPYPPPPPLGDGQRKEEADTDLLRRHQQQQQQQQISSGLLRFRSAPSSLFGEVMEEFFPPRPSSPDTESMFARFLAPPDPRGEFRDKPPAGGGQRNPQFPSAPAPQPASAEGVGVQHGSGFPPAPQMMYHSQQPQQMTNHGGADGAYGVVGFMAMENHHQIKSGGPADTPNLIRQNSSPAGLFSHLNDENGYAMLNGMGGFRSGSGSIGDAGNKLKGQLSFSSRQNSIMSQISEMENEGVGGSSPEESGGGAGPSYLPGFPVTSWEQTSLLSHNSLPGLKRGREGAAKLWAGFNPSEAQNEEAKNHVAGLTHQFSLPKTSSEMAAIEKFLQFQDTVPFKVRAKRGCATHPRSIAERVRRTKISERMRKLQELVPNMDKQTNTSDMLDLAVDYIKDLQRQVKTLTDGRGNCTCSASNKHKSYTNQ